MLDPWEEWQETVDELSRALLSAQERESMLAWIIDGEPGLSWDDPRY